VTGAGHPVAGHLTCVGQSVAEIGEVLDRYAALGVDHVVALRGDPPEGVDAPYRPHPDGYHSTADLVAAVTARGRTGAIVSAYPERHPQSPSDAHDLDVLAAKVDAGADRAITQMCFDSGLVEAYRERVARRCIAVEIVPGVFPIHSFAAVSRFAARCGTTIPNAIARRFAGLDDDPVATREVAADLAAEQILELAAAGVEHVHLYTLNRAELALAVCERLGIVIPAEV
jgi:methylenetetrahydrofolate reductase (NADPH)